MNKAEKLWINGAIRRNAEAEEILRAFAEKAGISGKAFQHMSLLTGRRDHGHGEPSPEEF